MKTILKENKAEIAKYLERISKQILKYVAEKNSSNLDDINPNKVNKHILFGANSFGINNIRHDYNIEVEKLNDFPNNIHFGFQERQVRDNIVVGGSYKKNDEKLSFNTSYITLNKLLIEDFIEYNINKIIQKGKIDTEKYKKDLYDELIYRYLKVLMHELYHAYEDFVSKGRFKDKKWDEFVKKVENSISKQDWYNDYRNLSHEIRASIIQYSGIDNIYYPLYRGKREKESFKGFLNKVKYEFPWDKLTEQNKRTILKAFYKIWHDAPDEISE